MKPGDMMPPGEARAATPAAVEADRAAKDRYNTAVLGFGAAPSLWRPFPRPSRTWLAHAVDYEQPIKWDRPSTGRAYR